MVIAPLAMATFLLVGSFAIAADSETSSSVPALRGTLAKEASPAVPAGSVESFFQVSPARKTSATQPTKIQAAAAPTSTAAKTPVLKEASRALWHIMDNAGVPMFLGKSNDLDPSIDTSHSMPPSMVPNLKRVDKPVDNPKQTVVEDTSQIDNSAIHKIPQSELEGVELPTLHDAQTTTH